MTFFGKLHGDQIPIPPRAEGRTIALSWLGCLIAVELFAWLHSHGQRALLIAPFGASYLLVFAFPYGFFSQPRNVLSGHLLSSFVGLVCLSTFGPAWWSMALAVATAVAGTMGLRVSHPPAGANPIIIFLTTPGGTFCFPQHWWEPC